MKDLSETDIRRVLDLMEQRVKSPVVVCKDNRSFLEKLLTSISVSPIYSPKKGLHGVKVKASFDF